jgi:hypothetical protein
VHVFLGTACTVLLAAAVRAIAAAVASLMRETIDAVLFSLARDSARTALKGRDGAFLPRIHAAPHVRQIGGRAPPAQLSFTA